MYELIFLDGRPTSEHETEADAHGAARQVWPNLAWLDVAPGEDVRQTCERRQLIWPDEARRLADSDGSRATAEIVYVFPD